MTIYVCHKYSYYDRTEDELANFAVLKLSAILESRVVTQGVMTGVIQFSPGEACFSMLGAARILAVHSALPWATNPMLRCHRLSEMPNKTLYPSLRIPISLHALLTLAGNAAPVMHASRPPHVPT